MQTRHLKIFEWISNLLNSVVLLIASSFYNTNPQPFELAWSKGDASHRHCWWNYQPSPPTMHRTGGTAGKWANWQPGTPCTCASYSANWWKLEGTGQQKHKFFHRRRESHQQGICVYHRWPCFPNQRTIFASLGCDHGMRTLRKYFSVSHRKIGFLTCSWETGLI